MDSLTDIDVSRTISREVFHYLGEVLERAPDVPARGRSRNLASTRGGHTESQRAVGRWDLPWNHFDLVISHSSPIVAEGLLTTLSRHTGITARICSSETALWARISSGSPCLVFADYACAVAGARLAEQRAPCAWACVTMRDHPSDIQKALSAGVFGYLLADCAISDYVACVQGVGRELRFLCQRARRQLSEASAPHGLTPREMEVLRLVVEGCNNHDIGVRLRITLSTVKVHVGQILRKLGAGSRTQAAARASAAGILGTQR